MRWKGVELHNVEGLEETEGGWLPCRIPAGVREGLDPIGRPNAYNCCGCELRFNLRGDEARIFLARPPSDYVPRTGMASVWHGPFLADWTQFSQFIGSSESELVVRRPDELGRLREIAAAEGLAFDPGLVRLLLPYDGRIVLSRVEGDTSPPEPAQVPSRRLLAYGSSITHGGSASGPYDGYAPRLSRLLGRDLVNLGFAGSARMEAAMADYIARRRDWDVAVLELGINVIAEWEVAAFEDRARRFIATIAGGRPDALVYCTDIFLCGRDFARDPKVAEYRQALRGIVEELALPGLRHCPGDRLLDSYADLSADLVHPSDQGMEAIARNWHEFMEKDSRLSALSAGQVARTGSGS